MALVFMLQGVQFVESRPWLAEPLKQQPRAVAATTHPRQSLAANYLPAHQ